MVYQYRPTYQLPCTDCGVTAEVTSTGPGGKVRCEPCAERQLQRERDRAELIARLRAGAAAES